MRNLIVFIWKHYFFFLFFLLEVLCIYFIVQNNSFHRATFINSSNQLSGNVLETYSDMSYYFHLKEANEQLARENALLRSTSMPSFVAISGPDYKIKDSIHLQKYQYVSAKVVNNSINRRNNYITIDKGSKQGLAEDMAVISSTGVVGIIKNVSENFSSVMSLLHKSCTISSKVKKDGSYGPLSWDGTDYRYATLSDIPTHVPLAAGDTIAISPYSATFPENILVGTVESFERKSGAYFYTVKVKLSTDFNKLNFVYVVKNFMKKEQEELENAAKKND